MPFITALKPQRNKKHVNVYVDGKFAFGIDLDNLYKFKIKVEKEFAEAELEQINSEANFAKTFNRLLQYSMMRPRSYSEINNWFFRKQIDKSLQGKLLDKLQKFELVDDEKFTEWWVRQRIEFKKKSLKEIKFELLQKGIDSKLADKVLKNTNIDEFELAKKLVEKKSRLPEEKLKAYLLRKGFSWEIVKKVLVGQE